MVDTLAIYERLKSANLEDNAAKEIAEVFKDVMESNLVTKADPEIVKADLEIALEKTKADIIKWVAGMLVVQAVVIATLVKLF